MPVTKVIVTKSKLDSLAQHVSTKAGVNLPLTIDQMDTAVQNISTSGAVILQSKTVNPSSSAVTYTPDSGYTALSSVTVNAVNSTTLNVSANGTYTATGGTFYSQVVVSIADSEVNLQSKTVTPSNVPVSVTPDSGYHGLSSVTVNAIPSNYADVTNTTATVNDVVAGKIFIDQYGTPRNGLLTVSSYYVGTTVPDASLGSDGDIYLKI